MKQATWVFFAVLALPLIALAEEPAPETPAEPAPVEAAGASSGAALFVGTWTSEFGEVVLQADGNTITGTYPNGTITGEVDGNGILTYTWQEPDGASGRGSFQELASGLVGGRWGYGQSLNNGGDWTLRRKK